MAPSSRFGNAARLPVIKRILSHAWAEGLVVSAIVFWWLLALELPEIIMPRPFVVAQQIWIFFTDQNYIGHVAASTIRVIIGVIIAVVLGSSLALLPHWIPMTSVIVHERIKPLLNSFPSVGWAILAFIWFGPSHGRLSSSW